MNNENKHGSIFWITIFSVFFSAYGYADESVESTAQRKAFCIDFNWGEGGPNGFAPPGMWADADPVKHVQWYADLGANVIQTFAVSSNGFAWYLGGKTVPPQPGLQHNFLPEMVKLGHERGMKVMGYFCVGANTRWGQLHPDQSYGIPSTFHIPLTTAYLDFLCDSITEALTLSDMDGFMLDWVWNPTRPDGKWLDCEKSMYKELMGKEYPENLTKDEQLIYERKAIERAWFRLHATTKKVKQNCILWLSCYNLLDPTVQNSTMFKEVDWLMNEAGDLKSIETIRDMAGKDTQLVTCLVGWGDRHDARAVLSDPQSAGLAIYGFSKPGENSLPLPIQELMGKPIEAFQGNDRNIATLARYYNGNPFDFICEKK